MMQLHFYRSILDDEMVWVGSYRMQAPDGGQVTIATVGRDRTLPLKADVIHGNVQDCVEGDGPAQAPPSTIVPQCFKIPWLVC